MSMLKVENLSVHYGMIQAVRDVSFEVNEGEVVSLIGANGAGKTTILRTLSGLVRPSAGKIQFLGKGSLGMVPMPFIFCIIVLLLVLFLVKKTKTGRYIYAIGNSREAATILGIKVDQIRVFIYVVVGLISSLAGLLYVCRLGSAQSTLGESWPMNSIAASVIGGVSLNGGIGNPAGALIGAAIISIISNMIVLFGVNAYWQQAVSGIVVVLAISFSSIMEIIRERRARS